MTIEEIQKQNEEATKVVEVEQVEANNTETEVGTQEPGDSSVDNVDNTGLQTNIETSAELTEEDKRNEALKAQVQILQEKIKAYVEDLMTTDFTVEVAGYSADLFKNWVTIYTHSTKEFKDLINFEKEANNNFLSKKLKELTKVDTTVV